MSDQPGGDELLTGLAEGQQIDAQATADRRVGVVAQAPGVADADQEEVQGPGRRVTLLEEAVSDEAMIDPAERGGDLPESIRAEGMFLSHESREQEWKCCGATRPTDQAPWLSYDAGMPRCPLVTANRPIATQVPQTEGLAACRDLVTPAGRDLARRRMHLP
mgnify:CR=1 FL=1